jgi:large subunit ribosomal protein L7/L12
MSKVDDIIKQLQDLTLMEASELVTAIEETFGVSAAAPVAVAGAAAPAAGGDAAAPAEEKTEFNVKITDVPADKKIPVIKVVKNALNIGLADAKTKVEAAPFVMIENASKDDAEKYKNELVEAGATVQLE